MMKKCTIAFFFFLIFFRGAQSQTFDLSYYIGQGIQNSPLLKDYQNQISAATIDSILVRAAQKPLIEAKSELYYAPFYKNFGYDEVVTDGGSYQIVAGVSQSIFNKKELENKFQSIVLQKESSGNASKLSESELKRLITNQYLTTFSDFSDLSFNESFLDLMNNENEIVKQFVNSGIYNQTDYLSLLIETQGQEMQVSELKAKYKSDLILLNQICGITDVNTTIALAQPVILKAAVVNLSQSPFLVQYKLDSLIIINEKAALDVKYKPKVSWFADAGVLTATPENFYKHFGYSAGISLSVPIWDGKQKNYDLKKLEISENTRSTYQTSFKNQYSQQLLQLNEELSSMRDLLVRLEKQQATSDQLVGLLKSQLDAGNVLMVDYISALKNVRTISKNITEVQINILLTINEINYLVAQ